MIVPVVEGRGERESVALLLRRILFERLGIYDFGISPAIDAKSKGNLTSRGGIERFLQLALSRPGASGILIMCDADEQCAVALARALAGRIRNHQSQIPVAVVCPTREYEAWILASWPSVRGQDVKGGATLRPDLEPPLDVERIRNPKAWLTDAMSPPYKPTLHQASLTGLLDLELATSARSFRRLCDALSQLVANIRQGNSSVTP